MKIEELSNSYMNISLDKLHQEIPADYYHHAVGHNIFQKIWHRRRFQEAKIILSQLKADKILDIGCHGGLFTNEIAKSFPKAKITGIDISSKAIKFAQAKYPSLIFKTARAQKLPFRDKSFDLVTCFEVLEHIDDPPKVILEIKRVLKRRGFLLLLVPRSNFQFKLIWLFWTHFFSGKVWQHTHVQQFQDQDLDKLLAKTDFRIIKNKLFLSEMLCLILCKIA